MCSIADQHFFLQPGDEDRSKFNFDPTGKECTDADCTKGREYKINGIVRYDRNCHDFSDPEDGGDELENNGHELDFLCYKPGIYGPSLRFNSG